MQNNNNNNNNAVNASGLPEALEYLFKSIHSINYVMSFRSKLNARLFHFLLLIISRLASVIMLKDQSRFWLLCERLHRHPQCRNPQRSPGEKYRNESLKTRRNSLEKGIEIEESSGRAGLHVVVCYISNMKLI